MPCAAATVVLSPSEAPPGLVSSLSDTRPPKPATTLPWSSRTATLTAGSVFRACVVCGCSANRRSAGGPATGGVSPPAPRKNVSRRQLAIRAISGKTAKRFIGAP